MFRITSLCDADPDRGFRWSALSKRHRYVNLPHLPMVADCDRRWSSDNSRVPALYVLIPTRDRPRVLSKTIAGLVQDCLRGAIRDVYVTVVDDSVSPQSHAMNGDLVRGITGVAITYHGQTEQDVFLRNLEDAHGVPRAYIQRFIRLLGGQGWDLGAVRNYGACLALQEAGEASVIVLVDDDVELAPLQEGGGSSLLDMYQYIVQDTMTIAGGQIEGMEDVSWVETEVSFRWACMKFPDARPRIVSCQHQPTWRTADGQKKSPPTRPPRGYAPAL